MDAIMNMFRFAARFLLAFALAIPAAQAQTPQTYNTVASIAALKAMTNRPQVVQVTGTNAGVFNLNQGACAAADDLMQVQPTSGTTVCYTRMGTPYALGKSAILNGVVITDEVGIPEISPTLTLEPTTTGARSLTQAINTSQWATGTVSGPTNLNTFKVWADDIDATNAVGSDFFVQPWSFESYFGGTNMRGGRNALAAYAYLTAASNSANDNRNYVGSTGVATALAGDGGTNPTFADSKGALFGGGFVGVAASGAINLHNVTGAEFNVAMQTGSTTYAKSIAQFSNRSDDAVKGSGIDAMLWLYKQGVGATTMTNGILFDYPADANSFPFDTNSTVLKVGAGTIGYGIDLSSVTVTGAAYRSNGFNVSGVGAMTASNVLVTGSGDTAFEIKTTGGVTGDWLLQSLASDGRLRVFDLSSGGEVAAFDKGTGNFTASGAVRSNTGFNANGPSGLSVTKTVRDAAGTGTCTLVFAMGLYTGGTC